MTIIQITIDDEKIQELLRSDQGMTALLQPVLNQLLQAEMTEHLGPSFTTRNEAQKKRKATSLEKSVSPSARGQGAFLDEHHNGETACEQS